MADAIAIIREYRLDPRMTANERKSWRRLADECANEYEEPTTLIEGMTVISRWLVHLLGLASERSDDQVPDLLYSSLIDHARAVDDEFGRGSGSASDEEA